MDYNYLTNKNLDETLFEYLNEILKVITKEIEIVEIKESLGRVTSEAVYAIISSPDYLASAMDGVAVSAETTFGATETTPIVLSTSDYKLIDTGDPIPGKYDAVVMIEDVIKLENNNIKLIQSVYPGQNIRQIGEDICKDEMVVTSNTFIKPADLGALISAGVSNIKVWKLPVVGIIPTGDEIIKPEIPHEKGKIIEFNSAVFSALLKTWGIPSITFDIIPDDYDLIKNTLYKALEVCDIVLINAGASAGRDDYTASIIKDSGKLITHGISIKPGKPTVLGIVNNKPVIGIPGYPVSGIIVMENIIKPVIETYISYNFDKTDTIKAILIRKIPSSLKYQEFIRIKLAKINNEYKAIPLSQGAGIITSYTKANGILNIPKNSEGFENGATVNIQLLSDLETINNTILFNGSHDPLIYEIADILRKSDKNYIADSINSGSIAGISAIKRNEAHIAGIHLLDETSGTYNIPFIKKHFQCHNDYILVKGIKREQGFIVQKGNPLNIKNINDLIRKDVKFVNRQKGSGTRILLDYLLRKEKINSDDIYGYNHEEYTHLSTAIQVHEKTSDITIGIRSAANIYDLYFIPICEEEYDFLVQKDFAMSKLYQMFIDILKSETLHNRLSKLGGYDFEHCGEIVTDI